MRGRHVGHRKLKKNGQNKFEKNVCTILSLFRPFGILGQGKMKGFPAILFFEVAIIQSRPLKKTAVVTHALTVRPHFQVLIFKRYVP